MKCVGVVFAAILLLGLSVPMLEQTSEMPARSSTIYLLSAFAVSPSTWAYVGDTVTFFANATSDSGTTLNFTIYYDYLLANGSINPCSPVSVDTTPNPGSISKTYVYNAPGNYTYSDDNQYVVHLVINDGMGGWRNSTRYVTIVESWAPEFTPSPLQIIDWEIGVPLNLSVTCWDKDDDNLTLTWDFGDGTDIATNLTGPAALGVVCSQTHAWNPDPEDLYGLGDTYITYYLNLSLTDGCGQWTNTTTEIRLHLPHNFAPQIDSVLVDGEWFAAVDPGDTVQISASASDAEGEPLTWTFVFNNGTSDYRTVVNHTAGAAPGELVWCNITHVFGSEGRHGVTVNVSDALIPYQVWPHNVSLTVPVDVMLNSAPYAMESINVNPNYPIIWLPDKDYVLVTYSMDVYDPDGDLITVTWAFGDGSPLEVNASEGGICIYCFSQVRNYTEAGWKNVSVVITDGRPGHEIFRNVSVFVNSTNRPPSAVSFQPLALGGGIFAWVEEVVEFELVISDPEADPVEVIIDWGDGSPVLWLNLTDYVDKNVTAYFDHTYVIRGNYTITITYTDNQIGILDHTKTYSCGLEVRELGEIPEFGSVLPVALVLMLVLIASASAARRGRLR